MINIPDQLQESRGLKTILPLIIGATFLLAGCNGGDDSSTTFNSETVPAPVASTIAVGDWYRPPLNVTWQWQLKGKVNTGYPVEIYDTDLFDSSEPLIDSIQLSGSKVTCYFSAGSYEKWRPDVSEFSEADLGETLEGWED